MIVFVLLSVFRCPCDVPPAAHSLQGLCLWLSAHLFPRTQLFPPHCIHRAILPLSKLFSSPMISLKREHHQPSLPPLNFTLISLSIYFVKSNIFSFFGFSPPGAEWPPLPPLALPLSPPPRPPPRPRKLPRSDMLQRAGVEQWRCRQREARE